MVNHSWPGLVAVRRLHHELRFAVACAVRRAHRSRPERGAVRLRVGSQIALP
jgi:hypothetical protein